MSTTERVYELVRHNISPTVSSEWMKRVLGRARIVLAHFLARRTPDDWDLAASQARGYCLPHLDASAVTAG
jgi:hypothetical protein